MSPLAGNDFRTITDASGRTSPGKRLKLSGIHSTTLSRCRLPELRAGAKELRQYVEELSRVCDCYISAHPNAGLPNAFWVTMKPPTCY